MDPSDEEKALHPSWAAGGKSIAEEAAAVYGNGPGATKEAELLQKDIMDRLDSAKIYVDELARTKLHQRIDEFLDVVKPKPPSP